MTSESFSRCCLAVLVEKPRDHRCFASERFSRSGTQNQSNFYNDLSIMSAEATQGLTEEQVADLKEAFSMFDINGDGKYNNRQLAVVLKLLFHTLHDACIQSFLVQLEGDGFRVAWRIGEHF